MTRLLVACLLLTGCLGSDGQPDRLLLGTTHTVEDSGLLDSLLLAFRTAHPEQDIQVVVAGTGEVLQLGSRGDVDVLMTHAPEAEQSAVRTGWLTDRRAVMHNYFLLLGPPQDPLDIRGTVDARSAFSRMRDARAAFVSRGDDSGTHKKELELWRAVGVFPPDWQGYLEAGAGMADALRLASQRQAYILSDRATFLNLRPELQLEIVLAGDSVLLNEYSVLRSVRGANHAGAELFAAWLTAPQAQSMIGSYGVSRFGEALFVSDAVADSSPPGKRREP